MLLLFCLLKEKKSSFDLLLTFFGFCLEKIRATIKTSLWKKTVIPKTGFSGFNLVSVFFLPNHTN